MGPMVQRLVDWLRARSRRRRGRLFCEHLNPRESDRILDLGSEDGSHIASIIPYRKNVVIADICREDLERGQRAFGFQTLSLRENERLPIEDQAFDIVYSSSVIEHVTVPKSRMYDYPTWRAFCLRALRQQKRFADEIRRVGKNYFVQTPNKHFLIESHSWLPLVNFLPRKLLVSLLKWSNRYWIKQTIPDFNLLSARQMKRLFPDATIVREQFLFLTKSLIAIKAGRPS